MQPLSKWQAHVQRKTAVFRLPPKTLVFNISNRAYTEDGLGQELAKVVAALHLVGKAGQQQLRSTWPPTHVWRRGGVGGLHGRSGRGAKRPRVRPIPSQHIVAERVV